MISVAIVDDECDVRRHLKSCMEYLAEREQLQVCTKEFSSGRTFLGDYQPVYDIILMDVEMPGLNGIETARALRKLDQSVLLVFVTNHAQYALHGYEVDAISYIMKPVNPFDFAMKMRRVISRTCKRTDASVQIKTEHGVHRVRTATIRYCEVLGHYVVYHTTEGDFSEYITLKEAEKKIGQNYFAQPHRCYLVNLKHVSQIKGDSVFVDSNAVPLAKARQRSFLDAFAAFIGGVG